VARSAVDAQDVLHTEVFAREGLEVQKDE